MAKDTTRSSRYSRLRETQIGLDSYSKGQELPTQRVHHAGLVSIGRHPDQFARKRYDVISANTPNNIPYETHRVRNLHETAWDESVFDGYGFHPFHKSEWLGWFTKFPYQDLNTKSSPTELITRYGTTNPTVSQVFDYYSHRSSLDVEEIYQKMVSQQLYWYVKRSDGTIKFMSWSQPFNNLRTLIKNELNLADLIVKSSGILDNEEANTVFRSEAVFDPMFYKHYKSEHHDRESRYFEKEDVSMSAFDVLEFMSGSKYHDLAYDENIYSYRAGIQEEWMLELTYRQTFNLAQEHPMSSATGIHRKITKVNYSGEIRNSNIQELYFEDWPVLLSFEITGSKVDADYVRAAESVLNEEIFFEENDISINPLLDDPIGIPNAHDPVIMNQLYTFSKESFGHSSNPVPIYFPADSAGKGRMSLQENQFGADFILGNFDSSIIIDQSHSSNHGRPLSLFLNDGLYYDDQFYLTYGGLSDSIPGDHWDREESVLYYTGDFSIKYEINGTSVTRSSYFSSVNAGTYQKAQIKLDADFFGKLIIFTTSFPKQQKLLNIEPYYVFRGQPSQMPLTPFNSYNKRNHINGHSGHIAEPSQRYDSIAFRGLKR